MKATFNNIRREYATHRNHVYMRQAVEDYNQGDRAAKSKRYHMKMNALRDDWEKYLFDKFRNHSTESFMTIPTKHGRYKAFMWMDSIAYCGLAIRIRPDDDAAKSYMKRVMDQWAVEYAPFGKEMRRTLDKKNTIETGLGLVPTGNHMDIVRLVREFVENKFRSQEYMWFRSQKYAQQDYRYGRKAQRGLMASTERMRRRMMG
jgi:hypothetical protein